MAKRNITLHDKYKSTTALYPKIDAKSLTPKAIEEITKITEVVVEEQVVPNPTPTGTPETLEYITINGIEYKIGGGTSLYIHNISLAQSTADNFIFTIINNRSTPFTKNDLFNYFASKETQSIYVEYKIMATGRHIDNNKGYPIVYVQYDATDDAIKGIYIGDDGQYYSSKFLRSNINNLSLMDYIESI